MIQKYGNCKRWDSDVSIVGDRPMHVRDVNEMLWRLASKYPVFLEVCHTEWTRTRTNGGWAQTHNIRFFQQIHAFVDFEG